MVSKQWKLCKISEQVVFPITPKRVVGVTRKTDQYMGDSIGSLEYRSDNMSLWTLTYDNYIIALDRHSINSLITNDDEWFCFICY